MSDQYDRCDGEQVEHDPEPCRDRAVAFQYGILRTLRIVEHVDFGAGRVFGNGLLGQHAAGVRLAAEMDAVTFITLAVDAVAVAHGRRAVAFIVIRVERWHVDLRFDDLAGGARPSLACGHLVAVTEDRPDQVDLHEETESGGDVGPDQCGAGQHGETLRGRCGR
jgi:hypothetical protein